MAIKLLAHSTNYRSKRPVAIDYIVIHYTGNNSDTAKGNATYFQRPNLQTSAHYFVDDISVYQSVNDNDVAWHSGNREMNNRSIGIEMCSKKDAKGNYYITKETQNNAAYLVKQLMVKYNISVDHVIRHYDVTKKVCPEPFVRDPQQWVAFKSLLVDAPKPKLEEEKMTGEEIYKELQSYLKTQKIPNWAVAEYMEAASLGITDGTNSMELIPRYQAAIMALRAYKNKK